MAARLRESRLARQSAKAHLTTRCWVSVPVVGQHLLACLMFAAAVLSLAGCSGSAKRPPAAPAAGIFRDVARAAGLDFRWSAESAGGLTILDTIGHGCAFLDYDGDGRPDILVVGNSGARLYHNDGNGRFSDVTARALPPPPPHAHFLGCSVADYDGDGHPDIFLSGYGSTALYHNEGNGTFRDVTRGSGLEARSPYDWTTSSAWADVFGDGRLDLYVCRYVKFTPKSLQLCTYGTLDDLTVKMSCGPITYPAQKGSLFRNLGSGRFADVTRQCGLSDTNGNGLGCMFCDYNNDGRPDLYVANDDRPSDLFLDVGRGCFRNVGSRSGTAVSYSGKHFAGMGLDWGDCDGDGRFDLLVSNFEDQPKALFHNEDGTHFEDWTYRSGIGAASLTRLTFSAHFVDIANSGRLDIVMTNGHVNNHVERVKASSYQQSAQLFRNTGYGFYVDASAAAGADFTRKIVGRGMAVADYDGDGLLDLLVVDDSGAPLLLHNEGNRVPGGAPGHWIGIRCLTRDGGPDAVGALLTVSAAGRSQIAEVRSAGSYLSADYPEVHFGLAGATAADSISVRWPGGRTQSFRSVAADHRYVLTPYCTSPTPVR